MPAGTVNLLLIFYLLNHLSVFHRLRQGSSRKFDMSIMVDLLLSRSLCQRNPPRELPGLKQHLTCGMFDAGNVKTTLMF